jgi:hypothetical protein
MGSHPGLPYHHHPISVIVDDRGIRCQVIGEFCKCEQGLGAWGPGDFFCRRRSRNLEEAEAEMGYTWVTNGLPVTAGELCERLWSMSLKAVQQSTRCSAGFNDTSTKGQPVASRGEQLRDRKSG